MSGCQEQANARHKIKSTLMKAVTSSSTLCPGVSRLRAQRAPAISHIDTTTARGHNHDVVMDDVLSKTEKSTKTLGAGTPKKLLFLRIVADFILRHIRRVAEFLVSREPLEGIEHVDRQGRRTRKHPQIPCDQSNIRAKVKIALRYCVRHKEVLEAIRSHGALMQAFDDKFIEEPWYLPIEGEKPSYLPSVGHRARDLLEEFRANPLPDIRDLLQAKAEKRTCRQRRLRRLRGSKAEQEEQFYR